MRIQIAAALRALMLRKLCLWGKQELWDDETAHIAQVTDVSAVHLLHPGLDQVMPMSPSRLLVSLTGAAREMRAAITGQIVEGHIVKKISDRDGRLLARPPSSQLNFSAGRRSCGSSPRCLSQKASEQARRHARPYSSMGPRRKPEWWTSRLSSPRSWGRLQRTRRAVPRN